VLLVPLVAFGTHRESLPTTQSDPLIKPSLQGLGGKIIICYPHFLILKNSKPVSVKGSPTQESGASWCRVQATKMMYADRLPSW
jgi:hypothetical protein